MKKIYLDMDGTIADLYSEPNWLSDLRNEKSNLFLNLKTLISQNELFELYPENEYNIVILSMTPKGASREYCEQVIEEKNQWLDIHFPKLTKRIYKKYGYNKNLKNSKNAILIDDNETIRNNYKGIALAPQWC